MGKSLPERLASIRQNIIILYLVLRHPRTKWYHKIVPAFVVAYALSPIDLIPDFIPVVGYLDDIILIPVGLWISFKLIPGDIIAECTHNAGKTEITRKSIPGLLIILIMWIGISLVSGWIVYTAFK
jgi:uncharacterized membrane protein YkvA (DUF1232 family)